MGLRSGLGAMVWVCGCVGLCTGHQGDGQGDGVGLGGLGGLGQAGRKAGRQAAA